MAIEFPSTPPADVLLAELQKLTDAPEVVRSYFEPLARRLGDRSDVPPREITRAIVESRADFEKAMGGPSPAYDSMLNLLEGGVVEAVTTEATRRSVHTGLMLDALERSSPEVQERVLQEFEDSRPPRPGAERSSTEGFSDDFGR